MTQYMPLNSVDSVDVTFGLITAFVSHNQVPLADLPILIKEIHATLGRIGRSSKKPSLDSVVMPTAAQIKKSIRTDGLVSFIDGTVYKSLKRHLRANGLDPDSYRQRYGLSFNYPMVAREYSAQRSELAKAMGLGRIKNSDTPVSFDGHQRRKIRMHK